jgi:hypothetical protein
MGDQTDEAAHSQYKWDEVIKEMIRRANIIVTIISLRLFTEKHWKDLPEVIGSGTNVQAAAVVLTMTDLARVTPDRLLYFKQLVRSAFWPAVFGNDGSKRPVYACATTRGPAFLRLQELVESREEKPAWENLWTPELELVSMRVPKSSEKLSEIRQQRWRIPSGTRRCSTGILTAT